MTSKPQPSRSASDRAGGETMRLARYMARAGFDSRRHAERAIVEGRVSVNGVTITELGTKVAPGDVVTVDGKPLTLPQESVTLMLHKPRSVITSMGDPFGRPTVADLLPDDVAGLFHVGRLDGETTGLLLFTNDGDLGQGLVHPRTHVAKRYVVGLDGVPDKATLRRLRDGIVLDGRRTLPADMEPLGEKEALALFGASVDTARKSRAAAFADVVLHEGRSRQIRQMFEACGLTVVALHRYALGPLELGALKAGQWRRLSDEEVSELAQAVASGAGGAS